MRGILCLLPSMLRYADLVKVDLLVFNKTKRVSDDGINNSSPMLWGIPRETSQAPKATITDSLGKLALIGHCMNKLSAKYFRRKKNFDHVSAV